MAGASPASRFASGAFLLLVVAGAIAGARLWLSYNEDSQASAVLPLSTSASSLAPSSAPQVDAAGLVRQEHDSDSPFLEDLLAIAGAVVVVAASR